MNHGKTLPTQYLVVFTLLAFGLANRSTTAQELRYNWKQGQQFVYEVEITVDTGQSITTYKGNTRYTVDSVTADQLRVTYVGGLPESMKPKEQSRSSGPPFGPFGPRFGPPSFGGPPGFGNPFGRTTFSGKFVTTNRITLTPRGVTLAMEGDSQLPYLLGNASLIPFETLPESTNQEWTIDSGVSISEGDDDRRPPFGPFGPFGRVDNKSVQAATEKTTYNIQNETPEQIVVAKTYQLSTPKTASQAAFDLNGSGTWTFDKTQNVSKSLEFNQKLVVHQDNTDVTFPITIKYRLLTTTELAKLDADAKRQREEHEKRLAEAKQKAEAPLTAEEKQASLTALKSGNSAQIVETLKQLAQKTPKAPDPEIVAALRALVNDPNKKVQEDAQQTFMNWSPDYKRVVEVNNEYKGHMPVKSTDRSPTEANPLYVGQIVQAHLNHAFWYPAEILELLPDGRVTVRSRGLGAREHTVARRDIQLAPDEVEQPVSRPAVVAQSIGSASTGQQRTWSDSTGEHKIQATFLGLEQGKVKLRRADGKEISVPLDRLSKADQVYVEQQAAKKTSNPFE